MIFKSLRYKDTYDLYADPITRSDVYSNANEYNLVYCTKCWQVFVKEIDEKNERGRR